MASAIGAVAHERRWRIVQLLQQWLDMRCVIDFLVRQIESDDLVTVGVDADMKLAPGSAFRSLVFFEQPFAHSTKLQSRAVDDQMQLTCFRTWAAGLGFDLRCRAEVLVEPSVGGAPGLGTLLAKLPTQNIRAAAGERPARAARRPCPGSP